MQNNNSFHLIVLRGVKCLKIYKEISKIKHQNYTGYLPRKAVSVKREVKVKAAGHNLKNILKVVAMSALVTL